MNAKIISEEVWGVTLRSTHSRKKKRIHFTWEDLGGGVIHRKASDVTVLRPARIGSIKQESGVSASPVEKRH